MSRAPAWVRAHIKISACLATARDGLPEPMIRPTSLAMDRQRVLLLTGASRGIGHATVKAFSDAGWRVLTISRHPFDPRCPWDGAANHIQLDLADMARVQAEMPHLRDIIGERLDALINNAAVSPKRPDGGKIGPLEMAHADWLHIFNVNFFACVALAQGLRGP